ncbi:MAG: hypothetical protein CBC48_01630 [bacterium TMED88]|nr:hypothetical protein [Deltaproteobacteria bacterium]OUV36862.1 MAG: hypothetical protein CBC48_01630 [bacterium TMED88]
MSRRWVEDHSEFEKQIGYARAVIDGDFVFVSGTTGYDYVTMTIEPDVLAQAEQCMRNLGEALQAAGSGFDEVVRVRYIFPERSDFEPCWPIFRRYLGRARPAATMIVAGLLNESMRLEVEVTARVKRSEASNSGA